MKLKRPISFMIALMLVLALSACDMFAAGEEAEPVEESAPVEEGAAPAEEAAPPENAPPAEEEEIPAEEETGEETEVEPDMEALPAEPQRMEFETPDGVTLVGLFYPTREPPAPAVILMHMAGSSKEEWEPVALALQEGRVEYVSVGQLAQAPEAYPSYNVFTFDFRGFGESGGEDTEDFEAASRGWLLDAYAALELVRTLPGVNPDRIVLVGSSIGADAAVDVCAGLGLPEEYADLARLGESCVAAMPVSPGSYLMVPYPEAVIGMGERPTHCMATDGDMYSFETCQDGEPVAVGLYEIVTYVGSWHGTQIFYECADQTPPPLGLPPLPLLQDWLLRVLQQ